MDKEKRIAAYTLGCKVNACDTQSMVEIFLNNGYIFTDFDKPAEVYLINTCTVTNIADKKSRQIIKRAKTLNSDAVIIGAGCMAEADPSALKRCGADIVIGASGRGKIFEIYEQFIKNGAYTAVKDKTFFEELPVKRFETRTRAYVKIQDGCSNYCAYCIVPYVRGSSRSRELDNIKEQCAVLACNGYKEIVISGIHINSYGSDLNAKSDLTDVISVVNGLNDIKRIRLGSIDPAYVTNEFINKISINEKLCAHFHLSLQSGCDKTLRAMNRRYDTKMFLEATEQIRRIYPNAGLTTDIIVGFPGESEADFCESLNFCEQIGFSKIHVFPFSAKKGTAAYAMPNHVSKEDKKLRASKFSELSVKLREKFLNNNAGKNIDVLFETADNEKCEGLTSNYITVSARGYNINEIVNIAVKREMMS